MSKLLVFAFAAAIAAPSLRAQIWDSSYAFDVRSAAGEPGVQVTGAFSNSGANVKFEFDLETGILQLTLKNLNGTPTYAPTGSLVGFGFDFATWRLAYKSASYKLISSDDSDVSLFATPVAGVEYGVINFSMAGPTNFNFDIGAGNETGGGSPSLGLNEGKTMVVQFTFQDAITNGLPGPTFNPTSFFADNGDDADIGLRYRGLSTGDGSDKSALIILSPIPEPSTYGLLGCAALLAIAGARRWKKSR